MTSTTEPAKQAMTRFRTKLSLAVMLVVSAITALALYLAQRNVTATAERDSRQNFRTELSSLHKLEELRHAALAERCRILASKPRIHAALEDNALDLLYPSAKDELRDLMEGDKSSSDQPASTLHAHFYRFLNSAGAVLSPANLNDVGVLNAAEEAQLGLPKLPEKQQVGYLSRTNSATENVDEVIAFPIFSTETGEVISALVVGFKPLELTRKNTIAGIKSGIWANGSLDLASVSLSERATLADKINRIVGQSDSAEHNFTVRINGSPHLLLYTQVNPGSLYPPAYEICTYPLGSSIAQLHRIRWQIGGAAMVLLLGGFAASHLIAVRFSKPVEQLTLDSEQNRAQRRQAEAALISTSEKLKRSTRYSADASHQLKSPVTVLRAGLESLLAEKDLKPEIYEELSMLLHQTHRLRGVIDDLLLLSQMDAGQLQIESDPVNLSQLVEEWLDDLSAVPDSMDVTIEKEIPPNLYLAGEKRYTSLILQNLLENARKYNRPNGCIRVTAKNEGNHIVLAIGNTGPEIPPDAQKHIFERFHHNIVHSNNSGHGLGLNVARNLTGLHGGEIRLLRSENDWTEFEVRFQIAAPPPGIAPETA